MYIIKINNYALMIKNISIHREYSEMFEDMNRPPRVFLLLTTPYAIVQRQWRPARPAWNSCVTSTPITTAIETKTITSFCPSSVSPKSKVIINFKFESLTFKIIFLLDSL